MDPDLSQLRALSAVVSGGTLEAAARALHVTPSAISQRLKALEISAGRVLLVRSKPVQLTPSGEVVLRLARQIEALATDTSRELGADGDGSRPPTVPIGVNADSLATWVMPALASLASSFCFELHRDDEAHTSELLRAGTVMAAITSRPDPIPGCSSVRLGSLRYRPLAAPTFVARWLASGVTPEALAEAPLVLFDRKDDLQDRYLRRRSRSPLDPPRHFVPSSAETAEAIRLGFGWGMLPDLQSAPLRDSGDLVELDSAGAIDVTLFWQQWKLQSPSLDRVAEAILGAAGRALL